jgi:gluconokinase
MGACGQSAAGQSQAVCSLPWIQRRFALALGRGSCHHDTMDPQDLEKPALTKPVVLVVMGVSGSGKSTVGALLAGRLGWAFEEGDALHPRANIEKMAAGHPLTDEDRLPWLEKVAEWVGRRLDRGENGVITCSALKRSYRTIINRRRTGVVFIFLSGSPETIGGRLTERHGHFMPPSLLSSQFADLEEPSRDEPGICVDVGRDPGAIAQGIMDQLGLRPS